MKGVPVGTKEITFRVSPEDYQKMCELAHGEDHVRWWCYKHIMEYVKWRHRDRRSEEHRKKMQANRHKITKADYSKVLEGFIQKELRAGNEPPAEERVGEPSGSPLKP